MKKCIILFLSLLITTSIFAQLKEMQIKGKPEKIPSEIVGKRDANGNFCAAIKVASNMEGLRYDSYNGVVEVDRNPGEDIVYLSNDERVLLVYNTGYDPKKIILTDEGIDLEPKSMWKITIVGEEEADKIPINIITDPAEAEVYIDGNNKGSEENHLVDSGSYTIRVVQEGYQNINDEIIVSETSNLFKYSLQEEEPIMVTIKSQPEGAQISLNGVDEGQTNKQLFKFPGEYNLNISKNKYATINKTIKVSEQGNNTWEFDLDKVVATIKINTNPTDADIYVNGELKSSDNIEVGPGKYRVEIKKDGYYSDSKTISIKKGANKSLDVNLEQRTGNLQIVVEPMDTRVIMKRKDQVVNSWRGSKYLKDLGVGDYKITFQIKGHRIQNKIININENKTTRLNIKMVKSKNKNKSDLPRNISNDMVFVKGGTYYIGKDHFLPSNESPSFLVKINSFYIHKYEVTNKEYIEFLNYRSISSDGYYKGNELIDINDINCAIANNGSLFYFEGNKDVRSELCPVIEITWYGAVEYCNWLSELFGLSKVYTISNDMVECDWNANGYRLPTEAEWEYAARSKGRNDRKWSGTNSIRNLSDYCWYYLNSEGETHKIGAKKPNDLGIYDMSGNVWEWCWDWYDRGYYAEAPSINPTGPLSGSKRVRRGGSWNTLSNNCKAVNRHYLKPYKSSKFVGFRITRNAN